MVGEIVAPSCATLPGWKSDWSWAMRWMKLEARLWGWRLARCLATRLSSLWGTIMDDAVGLTVGQIVGDPLGETVGEVVELMVGEAVGDTVESIVGEIVGNAVGLVLGGLDF